MCIHFLRLPRRARGHKKVKKPCSKCNTNQSHPHLEGASQGIVTELLLPWFFAKFVPYSLNLPEAQVKGDFWYIHRSHPAKTAEWRRVKGESGAGSGRHPKAFSSLPSSAVNPSALCLCHSNSILITSIHFCAANCFETYEDPGFLHVLSCLILEK